MRSRGRRAAPRRRGVPREPRSAPWSSIETGSNWVFHLFEKPTKSFWQTPHLYPEDPRDTFRQHVYISLFYEDQLGDLRDLIGADRILMGENVMHANGYLLATPLA